MAGMATHFFEDLILHEKQSAGVMKRADPAGVDVAIDQPIVGIVGEIVFLGCLIGAGTTNDPQRYEGYNHDEAQGYFADEMYWM